MREQFENLLKDLNDLKIMQVCSAWTGHLTAEFLNKHPELREPVWINPVDAQTVYHGSYITELDVIHIYGGFLGVVAVSEVTHDTKCIHDFNHILKFFEVKKVLKEVYVSLNH